MYLKSSKKVMSLCMALVFVLSLIPFGAMAAQVTTEPPVSMINFVNTSSSNATRKDTTNLLAYGSYANDIKVSGNWYAFAQFDLSEYREILENNGTKVTFGITVDATASTTGKDTKDFKIYFVNDSNEDYDASTVTYNISQTSGLGVAANYGEIFAQYASETEVCPREYTTEVPTEKILNALNQGKDNSIITLAFTASGNAHFKKNTGILTITYEDTLVDNQTYVDSIANALAWTDISNEPQDKITQNLTLPTELYGAAVEWSSDDEDVVTSEGIINPGYEPKNTTLRAVLTYKDGTSDEKTFDIGLTKLTYNYPEIHDGDTSIVTLNSAASSYITVNRDVSGLGGKAAEDVIYSVHDMAESQYYINYPIGTVSDPALNNDVMEFSVYLPTGTEKMRFAAAILNQNAFTSGSGSAQITFEFNLTSDGLDYNGVKKLYDTKQNEWYNIAFVAPKGMATPGTPADTDDKTCRLYVNGELVYEAQCSQPTSYGFRTFRFYGFDTALTDPGYYLDNIRLYSGDYVPSYDKAPSLTSSLYAIRDNVITIPSNADVTAADLKEAILNDEDTTVRLYNEKTAMVTELADDSVLADGNILVAASKSGTNIEKGYSYYVIDKADYSIEADILVNGVSANVFGESDEVKAQVKFNNYCLGTQNVKMYVAKYIGDELVGLWQDEAIISDGSSDVLSPELTDYTNEEGSTLKIILVSEDTLTPYIKSVVAQYTE